MTHVAMPVTGPLIVGTGASAVAVGTATSTYAGSYTVGMPNLVFGISFSDAIGTSSGNLQAGALANSNGFAHGGNIQVVTTFGGAYSDHTAAGSYAIAGSVTLAAAANLGSHSNASFGNHLFG